MLLEKVIWEMTISQWRSSGRRELRWFCIKRKARWTSLSTFLFAISILVLGIWVRQIKKENNELENNVNLSEETKATNKVKLQNKIDLMEGIKDIMQVMSLVVIFILASIF